MESLKEELGVLKEEYKNLFLLLLADLTGSFTSFYHILIGKVPKHILILSGLGFLVSIFITTLIFKIKKKMDKIIGKMKEIE